jgi:hypothetical protein
MNHGVVMGVLDPVADPEEQLEALLHAELLLVAIFRDGDALHVLHDEIRTPVGHGSGIEHAGDRGMIHRGQGLTLGLEAGDDAPGRETRTDELDRHRAPDRRLLLGSVDDPHAALAKNLDDPVRSDEARMGLGRRDGQRGKCARAQLITRSPVVLEQGLNLFPQRGVARARLLEEALPLLGIEHGDRLLKHRGDSLEARRVHGHSPGALDSSRASQARASRQSSLMVRSETLIASALSFTEAPA